jgi:hypothetical protein
VLRAKKKSLLKNVIVKNVVALEDGVLQLTGGITFYKADVDLENVTIENVKAEDAINIVASSFTMNSVEVNNTVSDGLDSDFSQGTLSKSKFSNIGGDALDFSGSNVRINEVEVTGAKDKAISGGEESSLEIKNSTFNDIGVGIVSKDGSDILVANTTVSDYRLNAAMSYVKKDFYGLPSIVLKECKCGQGNPYVRQKGTLMTVDGVEVSETEVNVEKLYKSEMMK